MATSSLLPGDVAPGATLPGTGATGGAATGGPNGGGKGDSATSFDRATARRLLMAVKSVLASEIGGKVRLLFAAILILLVAVSGLNVVSSYVGRDLMTAIEQGQTARFLSKAVLWASLFAVSTVVAVILRYVEERLALLWREWLTRTLVLRYLSDGRYLSMKENAVLGNPDQRIADDARAFTTTTLSFALMLLNALFGIIGFSGVLWSISPALMLVAIGYALFGSLATVALGRPLVALNYDQSDREASFRAELVHVGENAESLALLQLEGRAKERLRKRLEAMVDNTKRIVSIHRSVGFFTTGYNYGIQLLPPLIVGPLFMAGKVEFGVITQSAIAFTNLLGAFSLIVNQFASISSYAAVLVRLGSFSAALEPASRNAESVRTTQADLERLVFDELTLYSTSNEECLVQSLNWTIEPGARVLVTGTEEARRALFRAMALNPVFDTSRGRIVYPGSQRVLFLPERPYMPPATLRELVVRAGREREVADHEIERTLRDLGLGPALKRVGGLDVERDFTHVLSLGEQQLLAVARVILARPAFVVLHNPATTLAPEQLARVFARLSAASISYVMLGGLDVPQAVYDAVLEIHAGGTWQVKASPSFEAQERTLAPSATDT